MDTAASSSFPRPAEVSTADSSAVVALSSRQRSRVTNGRLLAGIDGRSAEARRYRDLCRSYADDLGGASALTQAQQTLVRQAAALSVQSETMAAAMLRGEPVSDEQMTRVANSLSRTLHRLGRKKPAPREASFLARLAEGAR